MCVCVSARREKLAGARATVCHINMSVTSHAPTHLQLFLDGGGVGVGDVHWRKTEEGNAIREEVEVADGEVNG